MPIVKIGTDLQIFHEYFIIEYEGDSDMNKQHFFSLQPFWDIKLERSLFWEMNGKTIAQFCEFQVPESKLDCIPGIGLTGIIFSTDPHLPSARCYGVLEERNEIDLQGVTSAFSVRFMPGEFTKLLGIPSNELTNLAIALDTFFTTDHLSQEIASAGNMEERIQLLQNFLYSHSPLHSNSSHEQLTQFILKEIIHSDGDIRMRELEEKTGYSTRHIQTIITSHIGISPKRLCTQIRFQNALRLLSQGSAPNLSDICQHVGFYDQSHFIKTFQRYTHMTPLSFHSCYSHSHNENGFASQASPQ